MASEETEQARKRSRSPSPPKPSPSETKEGEDGSPNKKKAALEMSSTPRHQNGTSTTSSTPVVPSARTPGVEVDEESAFNDEESFIAASFAASASASTSTPHTPSKEQKHAQREGGKGKDNRQNWTGGKSKQVSAKKDRDAGHPYKKEWQARRTEDGGEGQEGDKARLPKYRTAVLLGYALPLLFSVELD